MTKAGQNLFDHIFLMRTLGVGSHFTRRRWLKYPGTHWVVTDVQPYPRTADRAKVRGVFKFGDWAREKKERRVRSQLKREWLLIYDAESGKVTLPATLPDDLREQWEKVYTSQPELFKPPTAAVASAEDGSGTDPDTTEQR